MDPFDCFDTIPSQPSGQGKGSKRKLHEMNNHQLFEDLKTRFHALTGRKQAAEGDESPLEESYVQHLLSPSVINHPKNDIKVLAANVIAEALRIVAPKFPFKDDDIASALTLLTSAISNHENSLREVAAKQYNHLISSLAHTHAIYALCKKSSGNQSQMDGSIFRMVKSLISFGKHDPSIGMQCAEVITDTIMASSTITEDVFNLLITALQKNSVVAKLVLSSHSMQLQHLIHSYFKRMCEELVKSTASENADEKRRALKGITNMFELIQKVATTSALCVKKTVETMARHATSENTDLRVLFVKGLGKIFETDPLLLLESEVALKALLARFDDVKPTVRSEILRLVHRMLTDRPSHQVAKKIWEFFAIPIKAKLVDHDDSVRKNAILMISSLDIATVPDTLLQALTMRCRDKKIGVRHFAINSLGRAGEHLKNPNHARLVMNAVIHTYDADSGANQSVVEAVILQFVRSYSDKFDVFCGLLDSQSVKTLERIFSKMNRLRWVVVRLFELKRDPSQEEIVRNLVHFLSNQLPVQHVDAFEEWMAISDVKDSQFRKSISNAFVYAGTFQESLDRIKRFCRKSTCDYFSRATGRMLLPVNPEFVRRLPEKVGSVKDMEKQTGILRAYCLLLVYEPSQTAGIQCVINVFLNAVKSLEIAPNDLPYEQVSFLLDFFCQSRSKLAEIHQAFQSSSLNERLAQIAMDLPLSHFSLIKSIAKAQALFLEADKNMCESYIKHLKDRFDSADLMTRARVKIIFREFMKKDSFDVAMIRKSDRELTDFQDVQDCIDSVDEESPFALHASMGVQKAYFDAQANVNSKKVVSYIKRLIKVTEALHEKKIDLSVAKNLRVLKHLVSLLCSCKIRVCIFDDMTLLQSLSNVFGGILTKDTRVAVQKKMYKHLYHTRQLPLQCSVFLLMTVLAESSRPNLSKTREYWRSIVETFRAFAVKAIAEQGVTLSDTRAITVYPEYVFPILLYLLAHSATFLRERDTGLLSIQRAFAVFFEECLGSNNECAGFLQELIRRIRALDDGYAAETPNTRILAEVSAKVLEEILKTRSLSAKDVFSFPGSVQLPHFFKKPTKGTTVLESTNFLPPNFSVIRLGFGGMFSFAHSPAPQQEMVVESQSEDEVDSDIFGTTSKISQVVQKLYGSLTEDDIALISWKKMRKEIAEALGVDELDEEARNIAWKAIQSLHEDE